MFDDIPDWKDREMDLKDSHIKIQEDIIKRQLDQIEIYKYRIDQMEAERAELIQTNNSLFLNLQEALEKNVNQRNIIETLQDVNLKELDAILFGGLPNE